MHAIPFQRDMAAADLDGASLATGDSTRGRTVGAFGRHDN